MGRIWWTKDGQDYDAGLAIRTICLLRPIPIHAFDSHAGIVRQQGTTVTYSTASPQASTECYEVYAHGRVSCREQLSLLICSGVFSSGLLRLEHPEINFLDLLPY